MNINRMLPFSLLLFAACQVAQPPKPNSYARSAAPTVSKTDPRVQAKATTPEMLRSINTLLVAPVTFDQSVTDLGSDSSYITNELEKAALTELGVKVITQEEVGKSGKSMPATHQKSELSDIAKKFSADSILLTTINRFQAREGSAVGGEPGNLNFTVNVQRVSDSQVLWSGNYHFKDEALFNNLLKAGDRFDQSNGAGWKDTKALLGEAFKETLAVLANQRYAAFTTVK